MATIIPELATFVNSMQLLKCQHILNHPHPRMGIMGDGRQTADDRSTGFPACWGRPSTNGKRINACSAGTRLFMLRHSLTVRPPMRSSRRGIAFSRNYLPVVIARWQQGHAGARPRRRRSNPRASRTNVLIASVELEIASPPSAARNKAGGQVVAFSRKKHAPHPATARLTGEKKSR